MALTSTSHLAITDVLCIPDRTGFSKYIIPATIQIIFAIPDELADKKKKTFPPPLPVALKKTHSPPPLAELKASKLKMDEDVCDDEDQVKIGFGSG